MTRWRLILNLLTSSAAAWSPIGHAANSCDITEGQWLQRYAEYWTQRKGQNDPLLVYTSNNMLRELNDALAQWTRGSEYVSGLIHFLFQHELRQIAESRGLTILQQQSPYFKSIEITFAGGPGQEDALWHSVIEARENAMTRVWEAIFHTNPQVNALVAAIENPNSPMSLSNQYRFLNGKSFLQAMTNDERKLLADAISERYSEAEFRYRLVNAYGLGLGRSRIDASFAAKQSSISGGNQAPLMRFSYRDFASVLRAAELQAKKLDWLFSGRTATEQEQIFQIIRANLGKGSINDWTQSMHRVARQHPQAGTLPEAQLFERVRRDLSIYQRTINLLDFLPEQWTQQPPDIMTRFNALTGDTGFLFLDRRGLGAANLLIFHQQAPQIRRQMAAIERNIAEWEKLAETAPQRQQLELRIEEDMQALMQTRESILKPSNTLIESTKADIASALKRLGLGEQDYVLWAAGDDMILKFRSKDLKWHRVYQELAKDPSFPRQQRLVFSDHRTAGDGSLASARRTVGRAADVAKSIDRLELDAPILVRLLDAADRRVAVYAIDGSGDAAPVPVQYRAAMRLITPDWQLTFPDEPPR
jgi:hypothetical protein